MPNLRKNELLTIISGLYLLPTKFFDWFFGQVFGIYHTMDNFTGRK